MSPTFSEADHLTRRCLSLQHLITTSLPPSKLSPPSKLTLLRLLNSEARFLLRRPPPPITSNIGHIESITLLLLHPSLRSASRLLHPVADIVCSFNSSPAWFLVSHRNPAHISSSGPLRSRCQRALLAARSAPLALKPSYLFLVFARGLRDDVGLEICCGLGAVEVVGIGVGLWGMKRARFFRVGIVEEEFEGVGEVCGGGSEGEGEVGDEGFGGFVACLRAIGDLVNFDTTALVAIVSGISNGAAEGLVGAREEEMRRRFKGNCRFVIEQVVGVFLCDTKCVCLLSMRIFYDFILISLNEMRASRARGAFLALKPYSLFVVFARGLWDDVGLEICCGLGAVEVVGIGKGLWGMKGARWFRVGIVKEEFEDVGIKEEGFGREGEGEVGDEGFGGFVACLRLIGDLVNFDTTALVAIVFGISNGAAEGLVGAREEEMRRRFKGNCRFVIEQVVGVVLERLLRAESGCSSTSGL